MRLPSGTIVSLALLGTLACHHTPPAPPRPLFPMAPAWTTPLPGVAEGPLAASEATVFVATREGSVLALETATGRVRWTVENRPGLVGAGEGLVVVRQADGTVFGMNPRTGATRWTAGSGIRGTLPPVLYKDGVIVSGDGLALLDATTGETRWAVAEARPSAPPAVAGAWLLVGETDGALQCRDFVTGKVLWSYDASRTLLAAPTLDPKGRVLLGTTARRFVSIDPRRDGRERWRWRIGGDVQAEPVVFGRRVLFTTHEDVLYALDWSNGHLAWRASLPSRPVSGPLLYGSAVLVACFGSRPGETFLIGFDAKTGRRQGDLKAPGELRTPPVIVGDVIVMALRERAVAALSLGVLAPNP